MGAKKYRKLPVVIEAIHYDGSDASAMEVIEWAILEHGSNDETNVVQSASDGKRVSFLIETLEGRMWARPGDYIIRGVKGEFYPCKADIFEMTYEVEE